METISKVEGKSGLKKQEWTGVQTILGLSERGEGVESDLQRYVSIADLITRLSQHRGQKAQEAINPREYKMEEGQSHRVT